MLVQVKLWNLTFPNPVGVAAGFDKGAEAVLGLAHIGFGFVEVFGWKRDEMEICFYIVLGGKCDSISSRW